MEIQCPGFVDVQVNGFAGVDYNDPGVSGEEVLRSVRTMAETGVTRMLPTIITGPERRIVGSLRNLERIRGEWVRSKLTEAGVVAGYHVEGPHISPENGARGAHPRADVRRPDIDEFKRWQEAAGGRIKIVTLAPEWPEAAAYIEAIVSQGVVASIGHTRCSTADLDRAIAAGATMSTHLGNGADGRQHKTDNPIWSQLAADSLYAGFIVDGFHLPPAFVKAAIRAKTVARSFLVTDAVAPAMSVPGDYELGEVGVRFGADGRVTLRNEDRLAGSALRMDVAVEKTVRFAGISIEDALRMAAEIPSRAAGLGKSPDRLRVRWDADTGELKVLETAVAGTTVFRAR